MALHYFNLAEITPVEALAGDSEEITIRLIAGPEFRAAGSRVVLDVPGTHGFSRPTCYWQGMNGYVEVFCSNPDLRYTKRVWDVEADDFANAPKKSFAGLGTRLFVLEFLSGQACEGDEILIKWGYTFDGKGIGCKVATIVPEKDYFDTIHVRYFVDGARALPDRGRSFKGYDRPVPDQEIPLNLHIRPREARELRLIQRQAKSILLPLDRFYNVAEVENLGDLIQEKIPATTNRRGAFEFSRPHPPLTSRKLPLYQAPEMTDVFEGMNVYFGDLHTHSASSNDATERYKVPATPEKCFQYAKNASCLDFLAVTDHHQPWDLESNKIGAGKWAMLNEAVARNNAPGEFLAFAGFEFRGVRGDTAIVLNECLAYEEIDLPQAKTIRDLWDIYQGRDYLSIPHFHNQGKLPVGEWFACPYEGVEPVLEIYSTHGSYESDAVQERKIAEVKSSRCDRHARYFLQQGHRYGLICNSDTHLGNPGCNGLTAVYARELTKEAVFAAIRQRQVYGTTNARIRLLVTLDGQLMGAVLPPAGQRTLHLAVQGERPFKAVDIIRNGEIFQRFRPDAIEFATDLTVPAEAGSFWYVRATQRDNHIAYASPIWIAQD